MNEMQKEVLKLRRAYRIARNAGMLGVANELADRHNALVLKIREQNRPMFEVVN